MLSDLIRVFRKQKPDARVSHHLVRGIPVVVNNTRPDIDTNEALARIDRTLALIQRYVPHHFRHLQRDFAY
ncbi:MAG: hypothetical protein QOK07_2300, partial [Gemmatimonadaceae bacterium]|nr:hypothetical protein [Gemmatimonadaceae bacterium]